jgi:hypothetical protein
MRLDAINIGRIFPAERAVYLLVKLKRISKNV